MSRIVTDLQAWIRILSNSRFVLGPLNAECLCDEFGEKVILNGHPQHRLPNTLNVTVPGIAGESLLVLLDLGGVAASLGSACAAGSVEPSHVLRAMGADAARARSGLRLSLGSETTEDEVRRAAAVIVAAVQQIRRERVAS
jgi:cysteine desulfurase